MNATSTPHRAEQAAAVLADLLDDAARVDLDVHRWEVVGRRARAITRHLAAEGSLPAHLVVAPSDPPVVAARLLAVAHRWVGRMPADARTLAPAACCA